MGLKISYDNNGGVILLGFGVLTGDDIIAGNREIYATPESTKNIRYQIGDYTAVDDFEISAGDICMIADQDKRAGKINPDMIIAIAAKMDLGYGLSNMWASYADDSDLNIKHFRTVEECIEWIEEQLK